MTKNKSKIEELVDLKKLINEIKKFNKDDSGLELSKKECHAISDYVLDLENKVIELEKSISELKNPKFVTPTRNSMGYYPVCPSCGRDLGSKTGSRYCECGAVLNWTQI